MPDESVYFFDGVFYLVIGVARFNSQLENQPVELVDDKSDFDTFPESMSDDLFCAHHDLVETENPAISARK